LLKQREPFTVIAEFFSYFCVFLIAFKTPYAERSILMKNALILCFASVRAHITFSYKKKEKDVFDTRSFAMLRIAMVHAKFPIS